MADHSMCVRVDFRSGDDRVAGRVRDQQGREWPFSSWLDLLTLIERLRGDMHDEVPVATEGEGGQ